MPERHAPPQLAEMAFAQLLECINSPRLCRIGGEILFRVLGARHGDDGAYAMPLVSAAERQILCGAVQRRVRAGLPQCPAAGATTTAALARRVHAGARHLNRLRR